MTEKAYPDMLAFPTPYQRKWVLPFFIFMLSVVLAITQQEQWLLVIPFLWILIPPLFNYFIGLGI